MKRRLLKNLGVLLGIVVAVGGVVGVNRCARYIYEDGPAAVARSNRANAEAQREKKGSRTFPWKTIEKTKGTSSTGLRFDYDLQSKNDKTTPLIGYMAPVQNGEMVGKFLLLPRTLESYWRKQPLMRDVVFVSLAPDTTVPLVQEPILVVGTLKLNTTTDGGFYYCLYDAAVYPAMPPKEDPNGEAPAG